MSARYYNGYGYEDDDDYDDYYDYYYYDDQVEESQNEEENFSINDLNEDEMEGNLRAIETTWYITISSAKREYKLAVINIVSIRLLKTTIKREDGFTTINYDGLEFITSAGAFVCKGVYNASEEYHRLSDGFKEWIPFKIVKCDSVEFIPWLSMQNCNPDNDNHANQMNPNNAEYYHSRGED